ncbi:MAG: hypothetical protein JJ896_00175 [Rhodothermales bacterium]|nr:hypothetical protein [Rhodothermales bacterium]MBO6778042.1 hypothetical protein [Rhodothermales bacterium]
MISAEELKVVEVFEDLSHEDLEWLAEHFELMELQAEEQPFEPGDPAEHMMVILSGGMQISIKRGGSWRLFDTFGPGSVSGILPYSRMKTFEGRGLATMPTRMGLLHKDHFPEMLYRIPVLGQRLIGVMSDRVRVSARADQEREKMLALGKLSAGLAHELNNPAAAARRAADDLRVRLDRLPSVVARLARHGLDPNKVDPESGYCSLHVERHLSALELGDREDELLDWLEDRDIPEAWKLAPTLAEAGMTVPDMDRAVADVPGAALQDVIAWIEHSLAAAKLLQEIHASAERISELVSSVKSYSHMDRSLDAEPVRLQDGVRNTLTMLGHRIRKQEVIVEDRLGDLPAVPAYPGEMNQVWTNLIDNALDAMGQGGTLTLEGRRFGGFVEVRITDNGSGIPDDVLPRIFDPFYTTKAVGEGTGLGLEISHRIVTKQHRGQINVESEPGRTSFAVVLPESAG